MSRTPDLASLIRLGARQATARMRTAIPGQIIDYDADTQTATVQPVIRSSYRDPDGERVTVLPPAIANAPVLFPSGGGFSITWPLSPGDPCLLVFADHSTDEWRSSADTDNEPRDVRRFDLSDAIVLPGSRSPADPLESTATAADALVIAGDEIRLGSSGASEHVALANLVKAELDALWTKFNTHVHAGVTSGPSSTLVPTDVTGTASSVAASKVKAE